MVRLRPTDGSRAQYGCLSNSSKQADHIAVELIESRRPLLDSPSLSYGVNVWLALPLYPSCILWLCVKRVTERPPA